MDYKEIIASISQSEDIPAGKVRKILRSFIGKMSEAIESGEKITLPVLTFNPITQKAREAQDDNPGRPERKAAIMKIRPPKKDDEEITAD